MRTLMSLLTACLFLTMPVAGLSQSPSATRAVEGLPAGSYPVPGSHLLEIENKKVEWDNYRIQITSYELEKYLPLL